MKVEEPLSLQQYLQERKEIVDEALDRYLPGEDQFPEAIFRAVRYSTFAGGKRIRPILCMAAAEAVGGSIDAVLPYACAIELIHTYSLIHDDLPAMDNDDFRRGKPTSHKVFGEAIAVLAGDALLTEAFHLMTRPASGEPKADAEVRLTLIHDIAAAAGSFGMVGGQVVDIQSQGKQIDPDTLHYIHTHKTGAMILVSVRAGAILGGADVVSCDCLCEYGRNIGLAFQIEDDILDVEGNRELMGKDTGVDQTLKKATYPAMMGMAQAKEQGLRLVNAALTAISPLDDRAEPLRELARYMMSRPR
jgi:geranylgeranyl diphosphate synthase, type II